MHNLCRICDVIYADWYKSERNPFLHGAVPLNEGWALCSGGGVFDIESKGMCEEENCDGNHVSEPVSALSESEELWERAAKIREAVDSQLVREVGRTVAVVARVGRGCVVGTMIHPEVKAKDFKVLLSGWQKYMPQQPLKLTHDLLAADPDAGMRHLIALMQKVVDHKRRPAQLVPSPFFSPDSD